MDDPLIKAIRENSPEYTFSEINKVFYYTYKACGMNASDLIQTLGFYPNDTGEGRFEALLGEVRFINQLQKWGFQNIKPLKSGKVKCCDMFCERDRLKYAVEVFSTSEDKNRWPEDRLVKFFLGRAKDKRSQIDGTAARLNCDKKVLALVLNSKEPVLQAGHANFQSVVRKVAEVLNWGENYHFILMTGMATSVYSMSNNTIQVIPDEAIYRPLI